MTVGPGLVVVDKPSGWTSHDVVARLRRLAGLKRVGHAGTLDPMATGVLLVGLDRATRLLGHLALTDKVYDATAVLGVTTSSDDADGEPTEVTDARAVTDEQIRRAASSLVGDLDQVPPAVSAIKVGGVRSYTRARRGEDVVLAPRRVTVQALDVVGVRRSDRVEVDLHVRCTTGTYVRSLARDLGAVLGVGAHLSALRRTSVGPFTVGESATLDALERDGVAAHVLSLGDVASRTFPVRPLTQEEAERLGHGIALDPGDMQDGTVAAVDDAGELVALLAVADGLARPVVVFRPA
jgi:tRNA pseudouridine55 synthase